jgi:hypothetical protein
VEPLEGGMDEPTPSAIYTGEGAESVDTKMREWAHRHLDELLTQREELRKCDPSISPLFQPGFTGSAVDLGPNIEQYFRDVLGFASQIIGHDIREAVAPTYTAEGPEQRAALAKQLELVQSVWPQRSKSVGTFFRQTLWTSDLAQALEMLDEGQVQPIFKRASGRKFGWREKRFKALAALWAIHLEKTGQAKSTFDANDRVADAFGFAGGNTHRGETIARWRAGLAAGSAGIDGFDLEIGIRIASEPLSPSHDSGSQARSLSNIVFGTRMDGPDSLAETGRRYQAHKATVDSTQHKTKKRGVNRKKSGT